MKKQILAVAVLATATVPSVEACDFCSVYCACEAQGTGRGLYAGAAEQFTHFGTLQMDGHAVDNEMGQWLNSSASQLFVGYNFTKRFGVQFQLPLIHREFLRPDGFELERGCESGLGDAVLNGNFVLVEQLTETHSVRWSVLGGIKLPTGDSSRLAEELHEVEVPGAPESGIHGHDLALGSGSVDGIVGSSLYARWQKWLLTANVQYSARTQGDFGYQYADDLLWEVAPGAFLLLNENRSLALQLVVSGEHKGKDTFQGETAEDTAITSIYLGPQLNYTWSEKFSARLGVDLPVHKDNSALQITPDYRIHAAVTWRF